MTRDSADATYAASGSSPPIADALTVSSQPKSILDGLPLLIWTARADGTADYFNRQWMEYTGLSADDACNWGWSSVLHPDDRQRVLGDWDVIRSVGQSGEIETRIRRHDGAYRWFLIRANPLRDAAGNIVQWCGANTEIEDRKHTEEAARSGGQEMRLLVDNVPGMIAARTVSGQIEFVNRRLMEFFGQSLEELQQWQTNENIHPDHRERVAALWVKATETELGYESEARLRRADGVYRWCHYRNVPFRDQHGRLLRWHCLINDVEDLKSAEEALRRAQSRLTRATQLAALSEFAATIAHEINQPLAAILTNAQACRRWLAAEAPNIERATRSTDRIIRDGNAAAEVIHRLRSLFKHAPVQKAALVINEVIDEVCDLMGDELRGRGVSLELKVAAEERPVQADRVQLQQVLTNLVRNAIEAMERISDRPKLLAINARHDGAEILVEVTDHGEGIIEADSLFESFHTTKANGMGMGLAICRSIIEAHGGRIWATNNPTYGATFGFALNASE